LPSPTSAASVPSHQENLRHKSDEFGFKKMVLLQMPITEANQRLLMSVDWESLFNSLPKQNTQLLQMFTINHRRGERANIHNDQK